MAAVVLLLPVGGAPAAARQQIAFIHGGDIWLVGADGKGAHDLTRTPGATEDDPSWSPDGSQLAYMRSTAVWEMNADGTNQHQVVPAATPGFRDAIAAGGVAWSAKNQIAYMTYDPTRQLFDIVVANADGSGAHALGLDPNPQGENRSPIYGALIWSPDGTHLLFGLDNIDNHWGVFEIAADGTGLRHILGTINGDTNPALSPDASRIVYGRYGSSAANEYDIRIANADGSNGRPLTRIRGADLGGSWSPDGRLIAFASQRPVKKPTEHSPYDLYTIDPRTNSVHRLLHLPGNEFEPQWQPG